MEGLFVREVSCAAVVVENNVVAWILKNAQVKKEPISFENLMGRGQQA